MDDLDIDSLIGSIPDHPITAPLVSKRSKLLDAIEKDEDDFFEDWYTADEVKFLGGLGIFTWLYEQPDDVPDSVWQQFCHCSTRQGWGYDEEHNWWSCANCDKPRPHYGILFECDNCEQFFRSPRLPERHFICQECIEANQ